MKSLSAIFPALLCVCAPAHALNSGASFLKIDTDARAVSMGSAYTALASGVSAIGYNPAGLSTAKAVELGFSHTSWIMESDHDFAGVAVPLKTPGLVLGLGITRFSNGSIDARGEDRSAGGSFSSYDQAISLITAKNMGRSRLGIAVKYIESAIAGEKAAAVAVDLGLNRALRGLPVQVGLSVQNLGTSMRYIDQKDPLPLSLSAGLLVSVIPGVNLAMDVRRRIYDKQDSISIGTEYGILSGFALRAGYMMNNGLAGARNKGFSAGAGLNLGGMGVDYAFTPFGNLGNAQKITLRKRF